MRRRRALLDPDDGEGGGGEVDLLPAQINDLGSPQVTARPQERQRRKHRRRHRRQVLAAPLAACRIHGAKLFIAKLDRLARDVAFVSHLMESGVDFEAVDFPQANRLAIHILAAVAEHEARMISERTQAALAAASAAGNSAKFATARAVRRQGESHRC